MTDKPQDETIKDQIIALLEKGYKRDQLIKDFKFAERTVDAAIRVYKELSNGNAEDAKESSRPIADDGASAPSSTTGLPPSFASSLPLLSSLYALIAASTVRSANLKSLINWSRL